MKPPRVLTSVPVPGVGVTAGVMNTGDTHPLVLQARRVQESLGHAHPVHEQRNQHPGGSRLGPPGDTSGPGQMAKVHGGRGAQRLDAAPQCVPETDFVKPPRVCSLTLGQGPPRSAAWLFARW